jgi:large subunit ribosomal protein L18
MSIQSKATKKLRAKRRIRSKISGTETRPRLAVFRSNAYIYAQLINDEKAVTIAAATNLKSADKMTKMDAAKAIGKEIAQKAIKAGIDTVVFDRGGFAYKGRVQALADAAREAGLKF